MKCSAISLSLVLAGVAGCTIIPPLNPRAALQGELDANRAKWNAAGLQTYQVRYSHSCFCPPETVRQKNINIENGVVASAIYVDDGSPVTLDQFADVPTINELFDQIQEILNAPASSYDGYALIFEYDAALGYPKSIKLVAPVNVADGDSTQSAELLPPSDFKEKLILNRAKWNVAGSQTYQFRYSQFCFCPTDIVRQKDIIVENGEIAFAKYVDTDERVPDEQFADLPTINDLFGQIQAILDAPPSTYEGYSLNFEYDDVLGYPTTIKLFAPSHIADGDNTQTVELTPFKDFQGPLNANLAKWYAAGLQSYQFRYSHSCFCPPETVRPKIINVVYGAVMSATYVDDGSAVPLDDLDDLPTINDLFNQIQQTLNEPPRYYREFALAVEYDTALGYPRSIALTDFIPNSGSTQKVESLAPDDLQGTLDANRARWNAAGIRHYQFRYANDCSCPPDIVRPKDIIVFGGGITWARYVDTGWLLEFYELPDLPTIDDLFHQIQTIIHTRHSTYRGFSVSFEYDEVLGYPKSIRLVAPINIANGSSTQTVHLKLPSELQGPLDYHRAKWDAAGIQTYRFRYTRTGMTPEPNRPRYIDVVDGVVVSATYEDDGSPVPPEQLVYAPTINDLFDQIQHSLRLDAPYPYIEILGLTVDYDPELGYPRSIDVVEFLGDAGSMQRAWLFP